MSRELRIVLLIAAILTTAWILRKIRKLKVKMDDAIFWIVFAVILLIVGLFPEFTYWLTRCLRMQSPANLVFLIIIFLLIEKIFTLSITVSQLEDKLNTLSTEIALRAHALDKRLHEQEEMTEDISQDV